MSEVVSSDDEEYIKVQKVLLASANHDGETLRQLLRTTSASIQDSETGSTPLHVAIEACDEHNAETDPSKVNLNGNDAAVNTVKLLLENGAVWNDLNGDNETPGCVALRLGLSNLYELMVDAGVRAEVLLSRLDEYEALDSDNEDNGSANETPALQEHQSFQPPKSEDHAPNATDDTVEDKSTKNPNYLKASLRFQHGRILDESSNAVMMDWEKGLMERHADLLCPEEGLRVLNIGHGSGWIDSFLQTKKPKQHAIVEAHREILTSMRQSGWYDKPGVSILEGRWQDQVSKLHEQGTLFDVVYFDTFAEDYKAFRDFFSESLVGLLEDSGKFSFFNGLGADRQICYDVYARVVEMDLFEAGYDVEWTKVKVPDMSDNDTWKGVKRQYFALSEYKLPICRFM